jgi:hypothetical protein
MLYNKLYNTGPHLVGSKYSNFTLLTAIFLNLCTNPLPRAQGRVHSERMCLACACVSMSY